MPSADDINRSIEPGSTEYGDRQVIEDRIAQSLQMGDVSRQPTPPGAVSGRAQSRLASGPVSDKPITDGLSVGPGAGPNKATMTEAPELEKYRLIAQNARNPYLRHLARSALRANMRRRP